jgi:hypothetical protein
LICDRVFLVALGSLEPRISDGRRAPVGIQEVDFIDAGNLLSGGAEPL